MIRARKAANRYLAGLVVAFALTHLATVLTAALLSWPVRNHGDLVVIVLLLGLLPAAAAIYFGVRGWSSPGTKSWASSTAGLLVLFAALAVSHRSGAF